MLHLPSRMNQLIKLNLLISTINLTKADINHQIRRATHAIALQEQPHLNFKMKAWQIHSYGGINELKLEEHRMPMINKPDDVLIKIEAASLNPIDLAMLSGYARTGLGFLRNSIEFPLIVGRDFSGTIIDKGQACRNLQIGDKVYGYVQLQQQGSHAEYLVTSKYDLAKKPEKLTAVEAASIPYAAMTAWSALYLTGNLWLRPVEGLKILILGGSGGVGTLAVQILKSQKAIVVATASSSARPLLESLGADYVFDYKDPAYAKNVDSVGRYHIILDCANVGYQKIPSIWKYDSFINLNAPLVNNTDNYGLVGGAIKSLLDLATSNTDLIPRMSLLKWGFFVPLSSGFEFIDSLVKAGKVRPVIDHVYNFSEMVEAFQDLEAGHTRGKIVVNYI